MTRIRSFGVAAAILVMHLTAYGFRSPQADANTPLNCDQVKGFLKAEKSGAFASGYTARRIDQVGVDFEPDSVCGLEILQGEPTLRGSIFGHVRITTLTVQCEPVECEVTINNEVAGTTVGAVLTKSPVKPGLNTIKVTAPNHETQTAEVAVSPGEHKRVPTFNMQPLKGGLAITCEPAPVCGITIKGPNGFSKKGETTKQGLTVQALSLGEYEVEASAPPAYISKTEKVWVSAPEVRPWNFKLDEDPWGSKTDLQVFDAVVDSLGGKAILATGSLSKNTARMRLAGDPPSIGLWNGVQVVEYVAPNRLRWDLTIAASKWKVVYDGANISSTGDKKRFAGTEFAQELEHSIRLFSTMRLPVILSLILAKFDVKKGPNFILIADSPDDRYTFHLNPDFLPLKVLHEHLSAPRSSEELEFAQYKSIGQDLMLPHVVILRYPDRPKHEHIFEYDKIDTGAPIKESDFKP